MAAPGIFRLLVSLLLFALPVTAGMVEDAASTVLALLFLMGIWTWFSRDEKIGLGRYEKAVMIAFTAYFVLTAVFICVHGLLLESYKPDWSMGHEIRMLAFAPVFYVFLRAEIKPWVFWYSICAGAIVSGVFAFFIIYVLEYGGRVTGAYNPIYFGGASIAFGFMGLAGLKFFAQKHKAMILIPIAAAAFGMAAAVFSGSRGAFFAAPLLLLVFLIQAGGYPRPLLIRSSVIAGVVILTGLVLFLPGSSMDKRANAAVKAIIKSLTQGGKNIEAVDRSTAERFLMWEEALKIFKDNPWIGTGKGGYKKILDQREKTSPRISTIAKYADPHNMYLTNMASYGVLGLAMLLGIFIGPLLVFIRWIRQSEAARDFGYAGVMLVIAYMQFALTASVFWRTVPIAIYLILTAAAMAQCRISSEVKVI